MAEIRHKAKHIVDHGVYMEGKGQLGLCSEIELPEFAQAVEEYIAGGMGGKKKIKMGFIEEMLYKFVFAELATIILNSFGFLVGSEVEFIVRIATRGAATGTQTYKITGTVTKFKQGKLERGKLSNVEFEVEATKTILLIDGKEHLNIDFDAGTQIINGVDQRDEINKAIGAK